MIMDRAKTINVDKGYIYYYYNYYY